MHTAIIVSIKRKSDSKIFSLSDTVTSDGGIFRGVINKFIYSPDKIIVVIDTDKDGNDRQDFDLSELD